MKRRQQVLLILSSIIIVSHCEEGTCGGTVQGHLKSTMRSLWLDEFLPQQTKEAERLINAKDAKINGLEEKDEQLEGLINAKDTKINGLEGKYEQLEDLINRLQQQVQVLKTPAFRPFYSSCFTFVSLLMKLFIFRKSKGKFSFLLKDSELDVQSIME